MDRFRIDGGHTNFSIVISELERRHLVEARVSSQPKLIKKDAKRDQWICSQILRDMKILT